MKTMKDFVDELNPSIVGLQEHAAKDILSELDISYRVVERDAERFMCIANFDPNRVNMVVKEGVVVSYTLG